MVFVGEPKTEWIKAYSVILATQTAVINKIQRHFHLSINESKTMGFSGARMDRFARKMIADAGLPPYPHGLGHSLGREIHEHPKLNRKKDEQIGPRMAFTIEPATYIKGEYGIRIEDTVCLNTEGLEQLTRSPKEMIIV